MHITTGLYIVIFLVIVPIVIFCAVFGATFGFRFSTNMQDWAHFANYSQGTIGVYLSILAFSGLLWTISQQMKNITLLKDQILRQDTENKNAAIETHFFHLLTTYQNLIGNFHFEDGAGQSALLAAMQRLEGFLNFSRIPQYDPNNLQWISKYAHQLPQSQRPNLDHQINGINTLVLIIGANTNFLNLMERAYEVSREFSDPQKCAAMLKTLRYSTSASEQSMLRHLLLISKHLGSLVGDTGGIIREIHLTPEAFDADMARLDPVYEQVAYYRKHGPHP